MPERVFIVGTGRVGTGLALALADTPHTLVGLWNRSAPGRNIAAELTGREVAGGPLEQVQALAQASVVLVTVSDAAIGLVSPTLAGAPLAPGTLVAHASGCLTASALEGLESFSRGSFHPLCACPTPVRAAQALRTCRYVVEGDPAAVARLHALGRDLSGHTGEVAADQKARYHAAAVIASNLMVALLDVAVGEMAKAGLANMKNDLVSLAQGALSQVGKLDLPRALTGPVARGDSETVARHLAILNSDTREIYSALSRRALDIARAGGLEARLVDEVVALLRQGES